MVVPETADDFRAAVSAHRSLDASKGVSFHTFSLPEDRSTRLLIKNLGRRMPEDVVREELGALGICVQRVMLLRSKRRDRDSEMDRPVTPHFIVTVARSPEVTKICSIKQIYGLRVAVETYTAPKGPLQCKRCQRFGHTQRNCGYAACCVACGETHISCEYSTPKSSLNAASAGVTTPPNTGVARNGRRQKRLLQGRHLGAYNEKRRAHRRSSEGAQSAPTVT
jgi:hypothetical protein